MEMKYGLPSKWYNQRIEGKFEKLRKTWRDKLFHSFSKLEFMFYTLRWLIGRMPYKSFEFFKLLDTVLPVTLLPFTYSKFYMRLHCFLEIYSLKHHTYNLNFVIVKLKVNGLDLVNWNHIEWIRHSLDISKLINEDRFVDLQVKFNA